LALPAVVKDVSESVQAELDEKLRKFLLRYSRRVDWVQEPMLSLPETMSTGFSPSLKIEFAN
jgi:hypothetical protein